MINPLENTFCLQLFTIINDGAINSDSGPPSNPLSAYPQNKTQIPSLGLKGLYGLHGTRLSAICTRSPSHTMFSPCASQHVVLYFALGLCTYSFHCLESSSSTRFLHGYFLTVCLSLSDTPLGRSSLPTSSSVHYPSSSSGSYLLPSNLKPFLKFAFLFCVCILKQNRSSTRSVIVFHVHQFIIKHIVDINKVQVT